MSDSADKLTALVLAGGGSFGSVQGECCARSWRTAWRRTS
jgi:hypothetical protein